MIFYIQSFFALLFHELTTPGREEMNALLSLRGLFAAKLLAAALLAAAPIAASLAASDLGLLINGKTGKCLTIAGGTSPANNLTAVQFDCDGDLSRSWFVKNLGRMSQIVNAKTGKCLTIAGGTSTNNNVAAVQFHCDGDLSRLWLMSGVSGEEQIQDAKNPQVSDDHRRDEHGQQRHRHAVRLRCRSFASLELQGDCNSTLADWPDGHLSYPAHPRPRTGSKLYHHRGR